MLDRLYLIKLIDQLRNFEGSEEDEAVFDRHELRGNS